MNLRKKCNVFWIRKNFHHFSDINIWCSFEFWLEWPYNRVIVENVWGRLGRLGRMPTHRAPLFSIISGHQISAEQQLFFSNGQLFCPLFVVSVTSHLHCLFIIPTFVMKPTEYLCSIWFFWLNTSYIFKNGAFGADAFLRDLTHCLPTGFPSLVVFQDIKVRLNNSYIFQKANYFAPCRCVRNISSTLSR